MTEYEKRAEVIVASYGEMYDAGYAAGLKARLPSREEIEKASEDFASDDCVPTFEGGFIEGAKWLAANMRKGDE